MLFINRVFPPAEGATGQLLADLAHALVARGWNLTVLTSGQGAATTAQPDEGANPRLQVRRVAGVPFTRRTHWRRALSYLSLYPAFLREALRLPRPDVVVTMTDPPLQLVLGPLLKQFRPVRLVHWAQDVYPELAEELGPLRKRGALANGLRRLTTGALRRYDHVVTVGDCMRQRLAARGLDPAKLSVIPNWGTATESTPDATERFRVAHDLAQYFVVMYSGNFGLAHRFEAILTAAAQLQVSRPKVRFVFVGAGPRLAWLQTAIRERHSTNVRFLPFQPQETLSASLTAAHVHLASMAEPLCGLVVPSKVYGVLAAGRPCIFLGPSDSEAARLITKNECGAVLDSADGAGLARLITECHDNPATLTQLTANAARLAPHLDVTSAADQFDHLLSAPRGAERCAHSGARSA